MIELSLGAQIMLVSFALALPLYPVLVWVFGMGEEP